MIDATVPQPQKFEAIVARLDRARPVQAPRKAAAEWNARCPAHEDVNPSLVVSLTHDGKILLYCRGKGCSAADVLAALGLTTRDIREGSPMGEGRRELELEDIYPYCDESGEVRYEVLRYRPKTFRQRRPDGKGGWLWNLDGVEPLPFRLPELLRADDCLIVEGEKDVLTASMLGLVATCNNGGACHWSDSLSKRLAGKSVSILPDNDAKGREHAYRVAGSLLAHGVGSVRIVDLPGVPAGGDLTSYCTRVPGKAKSLEERASIVRRALLELIGRARAYRAG